MTYIGLESIDGQNHASLRGEAFLVALPTREMQRDQFLVAVHEMLHRSFAYPQPTFMQHALHLRR
ncbi:hypothetical protein KSX_94410 [Ktedonospora formicarum]|uniref:Uncharacterized protein n=1 Tax=Ktedonospora formicarum TaxID=2778364 RepID=A0A8J3IC64_9CHLR|nr:hypothetical protein KSX_94410 [Ktedonospora formicarum]